MKTIIVYEKINVNCKNVLDVEESIINKMKERMNAKLERKIKKIEKKIEAKIKGRA